MDIGKSFSYVFEDQQWLKKVLIGGIINLIPIVNFAATGYWLEETKRVYEGRELPLPEWDNFGGYFMKGLVTFVATLIYSLPAILVYCCAFLILPLVSGGTTTNGRSTGGSGPLQSIAGIAFACAGCLIALYVIALILFLPAAFVRYATTEQFGTFFQFGPAWQLIQTNIGGYVMAVVVFVIAAAIAGIVGGIVCGVGAAFTGFWASLVGAYLFGNFAKGASLAPPVPATV
jgi:hypothetical protein